MAHIFDYITDPAVRARIKAHTSTSDDLSAEAQQAFSNNSIVDFDDGLYRWKHVDTRDYNKARGQSWNTVFHQFPTDNRPGSVDGMFTVNYTNQQTPTVGVAFENFRIKSDRPSAPYAAGDLHEKQHLILGGHTRDLSIRHVCFEGWRGDAVFVGSQMSGSGVPTDYVAESTHISECLFDGVDNSGRQGITGGSVDGLYIRDNKFRCVTNQNMPGAIDIEPELPTAYARNIHVTGNRFFAIGPSGSPKPAFVVDLGNLNTTNTDRRDGIIFSDNYLSDTNGVRFFGKRMRSVTVNNNTINGTQAKCEFFGIDTLIFTGNRLNNCQPLQIGYILGADVYRLTMSGNTFFKSNGLEGAIQPYVVHGGEIAGNNFVDCGGSDGCIVLSQGGSSGVNIHDNDYRSPILCWTPYGVHQHTGTTPHVMWPGSQHHNNTAVGAINPYFIGP